MSVRWQLIQGGAVEAGYAGGSRRLVRLRTFQSPPFPAVLAASWVLGPLMAGPWWAERAPYGGRMITRWTAVARLCDPKGT